MVSIFFGLLPTKIRNYDNMKYLTAIFSCIGMCAVAAPQPTDYTRGIGHYPGAKSEYYAPTLSWVDNGQTLTNVARHRAAWASSAIEVPIQRIS